VYIHGLVLRATQVVGVGPDVILVGGLLVSSALLIVNVVVDVKVLGRTSVR